MVGDKLGIALSGGGFRASFFHIGVLAALADRDLLRNVEVISTVSGGSIVGALYYIKVKHLLERKEDREITAVDYQELVSELADEFLATVQRNLRLMAFANPLKNARMARVDYSRSDRMGELFDRLLYRPAFGHQRREPVGMEELLITPKGWSSQEFSPAQANPRRRAKVPLLVINATSLNTGRNWRFEATRMGEPDRRGAFAADIDMRLRLQPLPSYDELGPRRTMLLGHAVAASAAVPAIFHPLSITHLYHETRVELIDGGIHDNQGVVALLDYRCDSLVVSDGSSQMHGETLPGTSIPTVLMRTNEILMSRVREEQLLRAYQSHGKRLCLAHLQQGISAEYIPYRTKNGYKVSVKRPQPSATGDMRVHPAVREALVHIRTDLDAFNDAESFALMRTGYLNAVKSLRAFDRPRRYGRLSAFPWRFEAVDPLLSEPPPAFLKVLRTSSANAFKVFALYRALTTVSTLLVVGGFALWGWMERNHLLEPIVELAWTPTRLSVLLGLVFVVAAGIMASVRRALGGIESIQRLWKVVRTPIRFVGRVALRAAPWVLAAFPIYLYVRLVNPLYLKAGRLDRFGPGQGKGSARVKRSESRSWHRRPNSSAAAPPR